MSETVSKIQMPKEVAEAICNLKQHPDWPTFMMYLAGVADQKQHQLILAEADTMQVLQGECRTFMLLFNMEEGAEAARNAYQQGNQTNGPT